LQSQFTSLGAAAVSATATELNLIDGYTGTTAELNYLDITTLGTSEDSKAVTQASSVVTVGATDGNQVLNVASHDLVDGGLKLAGTLVTSSASEINKLDGLSASTTELDYTDVSALGTVEVSKAVTATAAGLVNHSDYQVSRPYFLDIAETVNAIGDTGGGTDAIDVSAGNVATATVSTAEQTFTFTNPSATGRSCSFTLILTNGGSQTVNWPSSVDWVGGTAPSLTSSGVDILTFTTVDEGTIWYGFQAGLDFS